MIEQLDGATADAVEFAAAPRAYRLKAATPPEQTEALVEKGKTLSEWIMEQSVEMGEPREGKKKKINLLWVLALLLFNLVMWAGFGWIVLRVLKSLW